MNVLVTGGAGYIGSVVVETLIARGHQAVVLDNLSTGHFGAVHPEATFVLGDLEDKQGIRRLFAEHCFDAVIHMASNALVGESMKFPLLYLGDNVRNATNLLEIMAVYEVKRLIFSSTCGIVHGKGSSPYGESKLIIERILDWVGQIHGIEWVSLRYFNAAGASEHYGEDHDPETHLIPSAMRVALLQQEPLVIYGTDYPTPDGTCIRDYVHVIDLADAHVKALTKGGGIYELGSGKGYSVQEIIKMVRKVTCRLVPVIEGPRRPGDEPILVAQYLERAEYDLGWRPQFTDAIIPCAWDWHREHPRGYEGER